MPLPAGAERRGRSRTILDFLASRGNGPFLDEGSRCQKGYLSAFRLGVLRASRRRQDPMRLGCVARKTTMSWVGAQAGESKTRHSLPASRLNEVMESMSFCLPCGILFCVITMAVLTSTSAVIIPPEYAQHTFMEVWLLLACSSMGLPLHLSGKAAAQVSFHISASSAYQYLVLTFPVLFLAYHSMLPAEVRSIKYSRMESNGASKMSVVAALLSGSLASMLSCSENERHKIILTNIVQLMVLAAQAQGCGGVQFWIHNAVGLGLGYVAGVFVRGWLEVLHVDLELEIKRTAESRLASHERCFASVSAERDCAKSECHRLLAMASGASTWTEQVNVLMGALPQSPPSVALPLTQETNDVAYEVSAWPLAMSLDQPPDMPLSGELEAVYPNLMAAPPYSTVMAPVEPAHLQFMPASHEPPAMGMVPGMTPTTVVSPHTMAVPPHLAVMAPDAVYPHLNTACYETQPSAQYLFDVQTEPSGRPWKESKSQKRRRQRNRLVKRLAAGSSCFTESDLMTAEPELTESPTSTTLSDASDPALVSDVSQTADATGPRTFTLAH